MLVTYVFQTKITPVIYLKVNVEFVITHHFVIREIEIYD